MSIAVAVVSAVLAVLLAITAARKLAHGPAAVAAYRRVGVPEERLNMLASLLLAAAVALLAGLWWPPAGIAAAAGLTVYFALAIAAHLRHHDARNAPVPAVFLGLAVTALVLHLS